MTKCPACGYVSDTYRDLEVNNDFEPQIGDVGICLGCGTKQTIDGAGSLILLSPEMEAMLDFKTKEILNRAQKVWGEMFVKAS
jgi:hypothetical protein